MKVVLERLYSRARVEQRGLASPSRQVYELGLLPGTHVDEAVRGHREVLRVDLLAGHDNLRVPRHHRVLDSAHNGRHPVAQRST